MRPLSKHVIALIISVSVAVLALVWSAYANQPAATDAGQYGDVSPPLEAGAPQFSGDAEPSSSQAGGPKINCTEPCHSKRQGIVKMHDIVRDKGKSCFDCHTGDENLMSGEGPKSSAAELEKRSKTDPNCVECHKTGL